mgnify:CR=1 FL=1
MVFVCFPQVQKSLNTDEFLTIFDKREQKPPKNRVSCLEWIGVNRGASVDAPLTLLTTVWAKSSVLV